MVSSTPRPHFIPGKDPAPILQEAGWAPGLVWTGGKSRPPRDSIPDRPTRSQSLYQPSYPAHNEESVPTIFTRTRFVCGAYFGTITGCICSYCCTLAQSWKTMVQQCTSIAGAASITFLTNTVFCMRRRRVW